MRKILIFLVLICLLPTRSFASVEFFALLPNPAGDDTLGEYIEIRNTGCQAVDIGGYHLYDAANKTYITPAGTTIGSQSNLTFPYSETKIALNNSGIETITLTSATGSIVDSESYSGTQRDNVVIYLTTMDENCDVTPPPVEGNTGTTSTGTSATGTVDAGTGNQTPLNPPFSGGLDITSTGTTNTGATESGSGASDTSGGQNTDSGTTNIGSGTGNQTPLNPPFSGGLDTTSTGTTDTGSGTASSSESFQTGALEGQGIRVNNTGTTSTGVIQNSNIPTIEHSNTGILFPDIFPTRQEPTNAIISGNIWDCGTHQPCRVNVTFDPIFTGSFLSKNYICEVITATGMLTTCNPNTLYFSADSSFSFRLTSKLDQSRSMSMSWGVSFTGVPSESATGVTNIGNTSTGTENQTPLNTPSTGGHDTTSTGVTDSGATNTGLTLSGIIFPQIIPTFQNYTNTFNSGDTLTCITSPCRVNFTLDPIFRGALLAKNYTCEIRYGTGVYDSCNPPQLYPIGTGSIEIILTHKASSQKETKILEILQNITIASVSPKTPTNIVPADIAKDTTKPIAIIDFDGKLKSYYEQVNDYEFNCYAMTCSVNLTGERSYDPDGGSIGYLWIYSQNEVKTTKDPGTQKYTIGDHTIIFRVIDTAGNYDEIRYIVHVLGPKPEEEKIKTKKIKKERSGDQKTSGGQKKKKKKKLKKMDFFDPPTIALQKSKFTLADDRYICRTTTKTCSLNLMLSGAEKGIEYTWVYDDGEVVTSKNPKSKKLSLGVHEITVSAAYSGSTDMIWTQILSVQVDHIAKAKKSKKPKKVKSKKPKQSSTLSLIPTAYASGVPTRDDSGGDLPSFLIFISLISITAWHQRRTYLSKKREQEAKSSGL